MIRNDLYERLRVLLSLETIVPLPKHEASYELLESLFSETEAEIVLSGFQQIDKLMPVPDISRNMGMPETELLGTLERMADRGLIFKASEQNYMAIDYVAVGANFLTYLNADPENLRRFAKARHEIVELSLIHELRDRKHSNFRVIPAAKPIERTININESVEAETTVLPFEILKQVAGRAKPERYALIPCGCREAGKLSGHPCERTEQNYCIAAGAYAASLIARGVGREVSTDELMQVFEQAERAGLVHQVGNFHGNIVMICNCCPCCCLYLKAFKASGGAVGTTARSNFSPERNTDLCALCEKCSQICPTRAPYHHYPHREDGQDDYMLIQAHLCLGCGLCASNCPNNAIALRKTGNAEPLENYMDVFDGKAH